MEENRKEKARGLGKGLSELLGEARAKAAMAKQARNDISEDKNAEKDDIYNSLSKELEKMESYTEELTSDATDNAYQGVSAPQITSSPEIDEQESMESAGDDDFEIITSISDESTQLEEEIKKVDEESHFKKVKEDDHRYNNSENKNDKFNAIPESNINETLNLLHKLPIELLIPNQEQPRKFFDENALKDLASSIAIYGIIQPIIVNKIDNDYQIVAGERRWRAAQIAGLKEVPVIIVNYNHDERLEIALIENIQRADLSPLDEAQAYYALIHKYELTQNELAQRVGKSRSYIANMVRLLDLDVNVKEYLDSGALTVGHARVLVGAKDASVLADKIVKSNLSVRKTEELVSQFTEKQNVRLPKASNLGKDNDILALEADLKAALGVSVSINIQTPQRGSLVIRYESLEQLDEICKRLCSNWGNDVS